jgi:hypothetical protein
MVQCRRVALLASAVVAMALTSYAFVLMAASQQISARDAKGELSSESVQRIMQKLGSLERTSAAALAAAAPAAAGASGAPRGPEGFQFVGTVGPATAPAASKPAAEVERRENAETNMDKSAAAGEAVGAGTPSPAQVEALRRENAQLRQR